MSAIPAASVSLKTMADGTLRISFDIEPMHAQDAFKLFAAPGTPAAIAALQVGYASAGGELQPPKPKTGALCLLAVQWCKNPQFQIWADVQDEESAKNYILATCVIQSRKELDGEKDAADAFEICIRKPYMAYLKANT